MIKYRVIRSARKTLQVEIRPDGEVLVRAPQRLSDAEIRQFVEKKADWIAQHTAGVRARAAQAADLKGSRWRIVEGSRTRQPRTSRRE